MFLTFRLLVTNCVVANSSEVEKVRTIRHSEDIYKIVVFEETADDEIGMQYYPACKTLITLTLMGLTYNNAFPAIHDKTSACLKFGGLYC